jgi:hypothetical protein
MLQFLLLLLLRALQDSRMLAQRFQAIARIRVIEFRADADIYQKLLAGARPL